ncbi:unnamed protein product [Eruca vesicaria subsp. sativa]|uniref:Uncharacterized protein n=1 Tax=Eruca vesicaria subsp. sativa TaxID=29727 RepID=A0ABC8KCC5_ERUVS|nr:unnamed protein product [Eruca vesicaria subsp. sativa]
MKSYIHEMFKASFTSLALEENLLAYLNPGLSHGPTPTATPSPHVGATASTHTPTDAPGAATASTFTTLGATPASTLIPDPSSSRAPASSHSGGYPQTGGPSNAAKRRSKSKGDVNTQVSFSANSWESRNKITMSILSTSSAQKLEYHLFKWIDEALIDEIRMVDEKYERVAEGITKFQERVMEKVKSEMVRVEHEISKRLNDKVNLEIARVS